MKVRLLDEAEQDLIDGYAFYENQQEGLGDYFLDSLFSDVDALQLFAGIHPKVKHFHRCLSKRFPYALYYDVENNIAHVWAILDCRRDPAVIAERLLNRGEAEDDETKQP